MSANYLLLKENKQDALSQSSSINQTILKEDANASSIRSTFETIELGFNIFLILTLIFLSINVLFKLIEKLLDYLKEKFHAYRSKTDTAHDEAKESSSTSSHNTQSSFESSKDPQ